MTKKDKKINSSIEDDIEFDEPSKNETDLSKTSELLLNNRYKRRKTILSDKQITKLTSIDVISQLYDIEFLKNWVSNYAEWKTSSGGRGRQDIVEIAKFNYKEKQEFQKELMSLIGRGK